MQKLNKLTIDDLKKSGLEKHAKQLQARSLSAVEMNKVRSGAHVEATEFPYFDLDGKPIGFSRYKLHGSFTPYKAKKPIKYFQVSGTTSHLYFPPLCDWRKIAADPSIPIYICEGEKKAAKACAEGFPTIGIGGVWNFLEKVSDDLPSDLIDDFNLINWDGRKVIIVFDSDILFKESVRIALKKLRDQLVRLGANPHQKNLPQSTDGKVGLDDFLVANSRKAKKAFEAIEEIPLFMPEAITGDALIKRKFAEPRWVIPGILPVGVTIIAGKPKIGKSWLVLAFVIAISLGRRVLDYFDAIKGEVAYLALEDRPRTLKERILKVLEGMKNDQ